MVPSIEVQYNIDKIQSLYLDKEHDRGKLDGPRQLVDRLHVSNQNASLYWAVSTPCISFQASYATPKCHDFQVNRLCALNFTLETLKTDQQGKLTFPSRSCQFKLKAGTHAVAVLADENPTCMKALGSYTKAMPSSMTWDTYCS